MPDKSDNAIATSKALQEAHNKGEKDGSEGVWKNPHGSFDVQFCSASAAEQKIEVNDAYAKGQKNAKR